MCLDIRLTSRHVVNSRQCSAFCPSRACRVGSRGLTLDTFWTPRLRSPDDEPVPPIARSLSRWTHNMVRLFNARRTSTAASSIDWTASVSWIPDPIRGRGVHDAPSPTNRILPSSRSAPAGTRSVFHNASDLHWTWSSQQGDTRCPIATGSTQRDPRARPPDLRHAARRPLPGRRSRDCERIARQLVDRIRRSAGLLRPRGAGIRILSQPQAQNADSG